MNKTISKLFLFAIAATMFACNNSKSAGQKPDVIKRDSTPVLALYRSAYGNDVKGGVVTRVTVDSFMWVGIDTVTQVKKWAIDTFYVIVYPTPVDSAISKRYNVPMKDSAGQQSVINLVINTDKKYVRSGWERADSTIIKEMLNIK